MNHIPSINQFLDEIDPDKTIDREKAMGEITAVTLLWAIKDTKSELSQEEQRKLDEILKDRQNFNFDGIYELFNRVGKKEILLASINDNINKVRTDYIKTQLDAMSADQKEKVLSKFPSLKEL